MLFPLATWLALAPLISEGPPPILQPKDYRSPDGHYLLHVDPSRPDGGGQGAYRVEKDGKLVWSGRKPWTLWEALVTDGGFVAGYAYTAGYRDYRVEGEFHAVILSEQGDVLNDTKQQRKSANYLHTPPDPLGGPVFHVPESNRVFIGVSVATGFGRDLELWCFQLPDGKELFRKKPASLLEEDQANGMLHGVRVVPGTPLVLTQWAHHEFGAGKSHLGYRYALLDSDLEKVWEVLRADDCTLADGDEQDRLWSMSWQGRMLLDVAEPRRFAVWAPATQERITFEVTPGAVSRSKESATVPAWTATEVGKQPYSEPKAAPPPELSAVELTSRGVSDLQGSKSAARSPIRDIAAFDCSVADVLRFVRREEQAQAFSLLTVDREGKPLSEHGLVLAGANPELRPEWHPITDHTWLAVQSPYGPGAQATAWSVDDRTGAVKLLEAFDCPAVDDVSGFGDGRFVVLAVERSEYTMQDVVLACDAQGQTLWKLEEDWNEDKERGLLSPEALCVAGDGRVWIVDNVRKTLQVFDAQGQFVRLLELDKVFGQAANYPSGLERDVDGGVLLDDFNGKPRLWRLDAAGNVREKLDPSFRDGRVVEALPRNARVAADGRLWSTDGERLLRMDAHGVVDLELGAKLAADELASPSACAIDALGRALIQDEKTGAVHVFDEQGKRLFVCRPDPKDVGNTSSIASLAALRGGGVLAERQDGGYLSFDATGKSLGIVRGPRGSVAISLPSGPAVGEALGEGVVVFDEAWKPARTVLQRPDQLWFTNVFDVAAASDGSIAVLDGPKLFGGRPTGFAISLFPPNMEGGRVISLPLSVHAWNLALGRAWAAAFDYGTECTLVHRTDGRILRFQLPGPAEPKRQCSFGFSPDGTELRVVETTARKLYRFALP